jgi:catechol 2,3-dioxygenase-like lactoylglutathione lyase family enzyme
MNYRPHHTAISVRNLDKSLRFYKTLGYQPVHRYDEPDGSMSIVHLKLGSSFLEIFHYLGSTNKPPVDYEHANDLQEIGVKHIALQTNDIKAALADLQQRGLATADTTIDHSSTGKASWFFIKDPDGVWVEIIKDDRYE